MHSIRISNSLNPDQARLFIEPDLGPNCLPRIAADDTYLNNPELAECVCFPSVVFFFLLKLAIMVKITDL